MSRISSVLAAVLAAALAGGTVYHLDTVESLRGDVETAQSELASTRSSATEASSQAEDRISELEAQVDDLQSQINSPDPEPSETYLAPDPSTAGVAVRAMFDVALDRHPTRGEYDQLVNYFLEQHRAAFEARQEGRNIDPVARLYHRFMSMTAEEREGLEELEGIRSQDQDVLDSAREAAGLE